MSEIMKAGGCLCGAVRFDAPLNDETAVACHCGQCRRQSGHHWASVNAPRDGVRFGRDAGLKWFRSSESAERGFCRDCGCWLFWRADGEDHVSISVGALDDPSGLKLVSHIFTETRPDYYDLADGLPQYARGRSEPPIG